MSDTLKACFWMIGCIASFSLMAVAGREVGPSHDTFEVMMYRSAVGVVIVVAVMTLQNRWHEIRTRKPGIHLVRNAAHFTGQNLWFYAVTVIPLAQVFALEFTSPLWVIVLSPLILGERITLVRGIAALMGFAGILIVARPDMAGINLGVMTAAGSAIFFALTITFTKKLTRTDSITCILFYLTTIQLVFGLVFSGFDGDIALPTGETWFWLVSIGCAGLLAHFCMTTALSLAPATVVVPIDFARLPTIAVVGWLVYSEVVDIWVLVGALVIFAGNYLNIWTEARGAPATGRHRSPMT